MSAGEPPEVGTNGVSAVTSQPHLAVPPSKASGSNSSTPGHLTPTSEDPSHPPAKTDGAVLSVSDLAAGLDSHPDDLPGYLNSLLLTLTTSTTTTQSVSSNGTAHAPQGTLGLPELDVSLNEILTRLTLLSQDTSSALEQSISEISRTVPRLTYDLQFMRESAASLHGSLNMVQGRMGATVVKAGGEVEGQSSKTKKSLEKLTHLDKLKTRMESARDILREAESWSTLESEITGFIASSSWTKAGSRLAEASRSMVVFQSTPAEYEARKSLLVSLQNELETALSTALKEALSRGDIEAVSAAYGVFEMMGREAEFRSHYFIEARKGVVEEWARFEGEGFAGFLPAWYASLVETLEKEGEQVGRVFPVHMAAEVLGTFVQSTLDALSPSLQSRLGSMADALGPEALPDLIKAYKATEDLVGVLHATIARVAASLADMPPSPTTPTTPLRPLPKKRSSSHSQHHPSRFSRAVSSLEVPSVSGASGSILAPLPATPESAWETTLLESFLDLQTSYGNLERRYLLHLLRSDAFTSVKKDVSVLTERSVLAFQLAGDAIMRCMVFTYGYGFVGLVDALGEFLAAFLDASAWVLESRPVAVQDELDFGLDYSTEDWAAFQSSLHVLTACRDLSTRLTGFEGQLSTAVAQASPLALGVPSEPSLLLLHQSPLNSSALQTLFSTTAQPLPPARKSLASLTSSAQASLQSIILSPLRQALATYPSLGVWTTPEKSRKDGLSIPTFSLSPTDTIARVSEGLLNLLRVFEVYAKDDALGYSLATLPYIDIAALRALTAPEPVDPLLLDGDDLTSPKRRTNHAEGEAATSRNEEAFPPEVVLSAWISSLALSLLADLTGSTLPSIQRLTPPGAAQLASDLGYLSNAVRALDVEWEDLERWRRGAEVDEAGWREMEPGSAGIGRGSVSGEGDKEARDVWARIGRIRGWSA